MIEQVEPKVGSRIRQIRTEKGLALRALAKSCDLSVNAISLIERGENSPTVSSLHKLALALDVPITNFFIQDNGRSAVHVKNGQGMHYRKNGCELESLGIGLPNQQLEPFRLTLTPKENPSSDDPITHPGQEFVYCLEGEIEYFVEDQSYTLNQGDSLLLEASQPHGWRIKNSNTVSLLMVFQSGSEGHQAHQQQLDERAPANGHFAG